LSYSSLPSGTYILEFTGTHARSGVSGQSEMQIYNSASFTTLMQTGAPTTIPQAFSGSFDIGLSGTGTILLQYRIQGGATGANIRHTSMRLYRKT
jgi:hypothetical protein